MLETQDEHNTTFLMENRNSKLKKPRSIVFLIEFDFIYKYFNKENSQRVDGVIN